LKIAEVNKKTAERIPAWNRDALKFLTTNIAYTGPRKPKPRDEKEISVIIVLIDIFCKLCSIPMAEGDYFATI
jgi:hypothetical protein